MPGTRDVASTYFVEGYNSGSLTASNASQLIIPDNPVRKLFTVFNESPDVLFLKVDGGATSLNNFIRVPSYYIYESTKPPHTGSIHGVWGSATGSAKWQDFS